MAPYIGRCIESLLAQSVPLEIIVVNDGSTDNTSEKVKAIRSDPPHSIVLLEQSNRGLSATRNVGLRQSRGEFIGFVDGDDWVEPEMYSTLTEAASRMGTDLTICSGEMVDHNTHATKPFHDEQRFAALAIERSEPFDARFVPDAFRLDTSACKRLYRRSWLQELGFQFGEDLLFEDILAHYQLMMSAGRVLLVNRKFYKYRINHPGRITDRRDESVLTVFEVLMRSRHALAVNQASSDVWASFIWFQSWVLQWLASQIEAAHYRGFMKGVVRLGPAVSKTRNQGVPAQIQRRPTSPANGGPPDVRMQGHIPSPRDEYSQGPRAEDYPYGGSIQESRRVLRARVLRR